MYVRVYRLSKQYKKKKQIADNICIGTGTEAGTRFSPPPSQAAVRSD